MSIRRSMIMVISLCSINLFAISKRPVDIFGREQLSKNAFEMEWRLFFSELSAYGVHNLNDEDVSAIVERFGFGWAYTHGKGVLGLAQDSSSYMWLRKKAIFADEDVALRRLLAKYYDNNTIGIVFEQILAQDGAWIYLGIKQESPQQDNAAILNTLFSNLKLRWVK